MKLASFDIFDTSLIRKCGQPENVFYLLAHRLYPSDAAMREAFLLWRRQAERVARASMPGKELTLHDIYAHVEKQGFVGYTPEALMAAEKTVEAEQLVANPAVKSQLSQLREQGWKIAFISDMYLDSAFLNDVLQREGCLLPGERVFVSCEHACRKSTGALYDAVRCELAPTEWLHHGDHPVSDVRMARKKGVKAEMICTGYTETEQSMRAAVSSLKNSYEGSILAGLTRYVRLRCGGDAYAAMAADFVVPCYAPFLHYIRRRASERGLQRLYFLSRDSYVLQKGMEAAAPEGIELRYLFLSRKALMLPYLYDGNENTYLAVMDKGTLLRKNVDELLRGLSIDRAELESQGLRFDYNKIVTRAQQEDFLQKIFRSDYTSRLQARCAAAYELQVEYFRQEGLLEGARSAMVDVGWLGTSRLMVNHILRRAGGSEVEFIYYGVRGDVLPPSCGVYSSYLRPEQSCTELTALVENYYSASPWPSTTGYLRQEDGRIAPTFAAGKGFVPNRITESNAEALSLMMAEWRHLPEFSEAAFHVWSSASLGCMRNMKVHIDLSPFLTVGEFDRSYFVKKMGLIELFKYAFTGAGITAFDAASAKCSVRCLYPMVKSMNSVSSKWRQIAFMIMSKLRQ